MKDVAIYISTSRPEAIHWAEVTAAKIIEKGAICCATEENASLFKSELKEKLKICPIDQFEKYVDLLISFGGDGTMLGAARATMNSGIPIMGINVGKLGFLAEFPPSDIDSAVESIMAGNYRIVDRCVLKTEIDGEKIYALNDIVIEKKNSPRMITVKAFANETYIGDYRSDGLILTTPTGSTAYSLSSNGPIVVPGTGVFCLTPISPHSLTLRPLIISDDNEIKLTVYSPTGEANFVADGQVQKTLKNGDSLIFKKANSVVKLVKPLDHSYFDLLRRKLLWASSPEYNDIKDEFSN